MIAVGRVYQRVRGENRVQRGAFATRRFQNANRVQPISVAGKLIPHIRHG
ncbi:MAG: hypothetical protein WBF89_03815 [Steroidobacteraceae bacterium]